MSTALPIKPSKNHSQKFFMDSIKTELFNPNNIRKTRKKLKEEEKLPLNDMKLWEDKVIRVKDKDSRFIVLNTNNYVENVGQLTNRSSFDKLKSDGSFEFKQKVICRIEKWSDKMNENRKESEKQERLDNCKAGKMNGISWEDSISYSWLTSI